MATAGNGGRTPKKPTPSQNGKTKPFSTVNYRDSRLAKEKQRRQYEQQKKEKIIFALFVVIIIVLILIAFLIFKKALGNSEDPAETTTSPVETTIEPPQELDSFHKEMCSKEQIYKGALVLVDASNPFTASKPELANIYSGRNKHPNGEKTAYSYYPANASLDVSTETLAALNRMADDFYTLTKQIDLTVAKAYDESAKNDHATGLAFDLSVYTDKTFVLDDKAVYSDYEWVFKNAHKYGFIMIAPEQSGEYHYHFRFVGIPAATYMYENQIGLGDFLKLLRDEHAFADGKFNALSITTSDGVTQDMYYVEAAGGDMTGVPIPENTIFSEISGDNMNGFIVTVRMS